MRNTILFLSFAVLATACIRPYQPDIQQGNILNNSDLKEIRYGMSKQEVLFILGTPMVIDPFNESRWDYFYSKTDPRKKQTEKRIVTAVFDGDSLIDLRGDVSLNKVHALEPSIEDQQHGGTVITQPTQKEKGFLSRMFTERRDRRARRDAAKRKSAQTESE